jgi:hypothetical protein
MAKLSVQLRDAYLRGLESNAGDQITIELDEAFQASSGLDTSLIREWAADKADGTYGPDPDTFNFALTKAGNLLDIKAPHVYARFLHGERWNRKVLGEVNPGEAPTEEQLKEYHPNLGQRVTKPKAEKAPKEPRAPKAPREAKAKTATKSSGPKPVAEPEPADPVEA